MPCTTESFTLVFRKSKLWLLASPTTAFFLTQVPHMLILHTADNFLLWLLCYKFLSKRRSMKIMERSMEQNKGKSH